MSSTCRECSGDAAAYALGALDRREAAAFVDHVSTCVGCRAELDAFARVTDRMALAVPQYEPPRRLRRAVMSEIAAAGRRRRSMPQPLRAPAAALAVAALAAVAIGFAGVVALSPRAPATRTIAARVADPHARAELRFQGRHAELLVRGMPQPAAGDVYEVWLVRRRGGAPQPTPALFGVTSRGDGVVAVPGNVPTLRAVLVTEEPAGGTRVPTGPPVIEARLS